MSSAQVTADLKEFARSGQLGPLSLGLVRRQVLAFLGSPTDWERGKIVEKSTIWKYGDIDLHFKEDRLHLIQFDWFEVPSGGTALQISPWVLRHGLPLHELENALRSANVQFYSGPDYWNPDCVRIVTPSGTSFLVRVKGEMFELGLCWFGHLKS